MKLDKMKTFGNFEQFLELVSEILEHLTQLTVHNY